MLRRTVLTAAGSAALLGITGTRAARADTLDEVKKRGTLVVDLIPTASVNPTTRTIRSAWTGVAASLLDGTIDDNTINAAVDEMFRLSPYLTATPAANP